MNINDLIQKLKAQGITATVEQIEQAIGPTDYLTDDDIPSIVEMFQPAQGRPAKRKAGSIEKSGSTKQSIQKLDQTNLPEVSSLTNTQVVAYISEIEAMDRSGEQVSDGLLGFLCDLYDRRKAAIMAARGAIAGLKAQDVELNQTMTELDQTINNSVGAMRQAHDLMSEIAQGGARLGDNFRAGTKHWSSIADRFAAHTAQSGVADQSVA